MRGDVDCGPEAAELTAAEVERVLGLVRTAQERLEAAEAEAAGLQALLDGVLAVVPPLVAVRDGRVAAWSAALERATGISAAAALGRPVGRVLPDADAVSDGVHLLDDESRPLRSASASRVLQLD